MLFLECGVKLSKTLLAIQINYYIVIEDRCLQIKRANANKKKKKNASDTCK